MEEEKYVYGRNNKVITIDISHGDHAILTKRGDGLEQKLHVTVVVNGIPTGFDINIIDILRMGVTG